MRACVHLSGNLLQGEKSFLGLNALPGGGCVRGVLGDGEGGGLNWLQCQYCDGGELAPLPPVLVIET